VEINQWNALSSKNFKPLYLDQTEVDSADFWTNRLLSSSSRSTAEEIASKLSHTRTLKSGCRFGFHTGARHAHGEVARAVRVAVAVG
jgi:hypothetical protein